MRALTPVDRAVATYCDEWPKATVDQAGIAKVNPETLGNGTPPEFTFRYIDISNTARTKVRLALAPDQNPATALPQIDILGNGRRKPIVPSRDIYYPVPSVYNQGLPRQLSRPLAPPMRGIDPGKLPGLPPGALSIGR